jgi:hypothetical protein
MSTPIYHLLGEIFNGISARIGLIEVNARFSQEGRTA